MTRQEAKEVLFIKSNGSLSTVHIEEAWIVRRRQLAGLEASAYGRDDRANVCQQIALAEEAKIVLLKSARKRPRAKQQAPSTNPFVKTWRVIVAIGRVISSLFVFCKKVIVGIWNVSMSIVRFFIKAAVFFEDVGVPVPVFVIILLLLIALSVSSCSELIQKL